MPVPTSTLLAARHLLMFTKCLQSITAPTPYPNPQSTDTLYRCVSSKRYHMQCSFGECLLWISLPNRATRRSSLSFGSPAFYIPTDSGERCATESTNRHQGCGDISRYALWFYKCFPLGAMQTGGQSLDNGAVVLLFQIGTPLPTRLKSPALLAPA